MAVLDNLIEGASGESVATRSLLRQALVIARRIQAGELETWVNHELTGYYGDDVAIPKYRGPFGTPVRGHYRNAAWQATEVPLDPRGAPDEFVDAFFRTEFRNSIAELETLGAAENDSRINWPPSVVGIWNQWQAQDKVIGLQRMQAVEIHQLISRIVVRGIVDAVRSNLLTLALDLQTADSSAGEAGGPTVQEPEVSASTTTFITNVYGPGANVALGANASQTSSVVINDLGSLLNAVQGAGLDDSEALAELTAAATSENKASRLRAFLDKVGTGAISIAGGVTGQAAKDLLTPLVEQYLRHLGLK